MEAKLYLGDGVYLEDQGHHFKIYTHNGIEETNTIFFNNEVTVHFLSFLKNKLAGKNLTLDDVAEH